MGLFFGLLGVLGFSLVGFLKVWGCVVVGANFISMRMLGLIVWLSLKSFAKKQG